MITLLFKTDQGNELWKDIDIDNWEYVNYFITFSSYSGTIDIFIEGELVAANYNKPITYSLGEHLKVADNFLTTLRFWIEVENNIRSIKNDGITPGYFSVDF